MALVVKLALAPEDAGIPLDTNDDDAPGILQEIAAASGVDFCDRSKRGRLNVSEAENRQADVVAAPVGGQSCKGSADGALAAA